MRFIIIKTVEDDYYCGLMERKYNLISIDDTRVKFNKTSIPFNRISWIKSDLTGLNGIWEMNKFRNYFSKINIFINNN